MLSHKCKNCDNQILKKNKKFCKSECYWAWMKGKKLEEIASNEAAFRKKKALEDKVYSKKRNSNYEKYYGCERGEQIKQKMASSHKKTIEKKGEIISKKKGKKLSEICGLEKSLEIRKKQSLARLGKTPWNKDLTKNNSNSLMGISMQRKGLSFSHSGRFSNPKCKNIFYQSWNELKCIDFFSVLEEVKEIGRCHFWIPYFDPINRKQRRYFPDFDIILLDGTHLIIEVKPNKDREEINTTKFLALSEFCEDKENYKYLIFPAYYDKDYEKYIRIIKSFLENWEKENKFLGTC